MILAIPVVESKTMDLAAAALIAVPVVSEVIENYLIAQFGLVLSKKAVI